jgi:hypothetical protein
MARFLADLAGTLLSAFKIGRSTLDASGLSAARTHTLPDESGTIALTSDIAASTMTYNRITASGDVRATAGYADLRSVQ